MASFSPSDQDLRKLRLPKNSSFQSSQKKLDDFSLSHEDSVIIVLTYKCNSRCRFCIIETEIEERLQDTSWEELQCLFSFNREKQQFARLILSGAEVSLFRSLETVAQKAIKEGGFSIVRIQTNARRMSKRSYAERLIAAGISEYFVSIHAHTADLDHYITRAKHSFSEMVSGVHNLLQLGAMVVSNTVICRANVVFLSDIVRFVYDLGVRELHLWAFLEIGDVGQKEELASIPEIQPHLLAALELAEELALSVTVKWFPHCLLGRFADCLDNHQPHMFIHNHFQERLSQNFNFSCPHSEACAAFGKGCDGIHERYLKLFSLPKLYPVSV